MEWNGMEELIYIYMFLLTRHRLMGYRTDPVGSASPSSSHALRNADLGVSACKGVVIGCPATSKSALCVFSSHGMRTAGLGFNGCKGVVIAWHLFSSQSML